MLEARTSFFRTAAAAKSGTRRLDADSVICAALVAGTMAYLWSCPRDFFFLDEGLFLYESRRLLEGAVPYRDFFELITPGAYYVMALLFRIFGVSVTTARMGMAGVHSAIAVLVFLACRRVGVRRTLAFTAAVAHLGVSYPAMTTANPHWFGTLLTLLILYLCLTVPWERPGKGQLLVGLATGALAFVQQQKVPAIAAAVCCVLVADHFLARRTASPPGAALGSRFAPFVAGVALIAVPFGLLLLWAAGLGPMWEALIEFPLTEYPGLPHCQSWGHIGFLAAANPLISFGPFIAKLPLLAGLGALRLAWSGLRGGDARAARPLVVLTVFGAAAALSVSYCPNFTHLAVIAPIGLVLLAETIEALLARLPAQRVLSPAAALAAAVAVALLGMQMRRNLELRRHKYSLVYETAAGLAHFRNFNQIVLLRGLRERTSPGDEIFVYPMSPGLYFLSGTTNPTRFQFLKPGYSKPEYYREVIDVLEARKVRFVSLQAFGIHPKTDPVVQYVAAAYDNVRLPYAPGRFPGVALLERKAPTPGAPAS